MKLRILIALLGVCRGSNVYVWLCKRKYRRLLARRK